MTDLPPLDLAAEIARIDREAKALKPPPSERIFVIVMVVVGVLATLVSGMVGYEIGRALSHPIVIQVQPAAH